MRQQNLSRTLSRPEFSQLQLFGSAHWRVHTGRSKCCPITKPIHYFVRLWAEPGEDLSSLISNSRVVALCASLQSPTVPTSAIWAARPYCISTGETRRQWPWSSRLSPSTATGHALPTTSCQDQAERQSQFTIRQRNSQEPFTTLLFSWTVFWGQKKRCYRCLYKRYKHLHVFIFFNFYPKERNEERSADIQSSKTARTEFHIGVKQYTIKNSIHGIIEQHP